MISFKGLASVLALAACWAGCSTTGQHTATIFEKIHAVARSRFSNNYEFLPNPDTTHVLCLSRAKERAGIPIQPLTFFVYELSADSIVYERKLENGSVGWRGPAQLIIEHIPGTVTGDEGPDAFIEVYDLRTQATTKPHNKRNGT